MSSTQKRIKKHRDTQRKLEEVCRSPEHVLFIHYSCTRLDGDKENRTPRVVSIAIRFLNNSSTKSFAIHLVAEYLHIPSNDIMEKYDEIEKRMLKEFFGFVKKHENDKWVHWNMRNVKYGFEALEQRYKVLGGKPCLLNDNQKYDLSVLLIEKYGDQYIGHPRLEKLFEKNEIPMKDFLSGEQEAIEFKKKEYYKIHQSTLSKVDGIEAVLCKTVENTLKKDVTLCQIYGITLQGLFELSKEHWLGSLIASFVTGVITSLVVTFILKILFHW